MSFIDPTVLQVQCHLSWLYEMISQQPPEQISFKTQKFIGKAECGVPLKAIYPHNDENQIQQDNRLESEQELFLEEKYNEECPLYVDFLSVQLTKCAQKLYKGEFEIALVHLTKARSFLGKLTGEHARLLEVMQYSINCLSWCHGHLQSPSENIAAHVETFQREWDQLQRSPKCQAVLVYLKWRMAINVLPYDAEQEQKIIKELVQLDPTYHIWWRFAYKRTQLSRTIFIGIQHDSKTRAISQMEIDFCLQAYELAPHLLISKFDKADMLQVRLEESHHPEKYIPSEALPVENPQEIWDTCLELLNNALETATIREMPEFVRKIMSRKAQMLLQLTHDTTCHNQGWSILQECVAMFPQDAFLHHRIGKIYHFGIKTDGGNFHFQDAQKARDHFKRALHLRQQNTYAIMKSYMKLFLSLTWPLPAKEALDLLRQYEPLIRTEFQQVQVQLWKGWLHFLYNPEELINTKRVACFTWVETLRDYPDQQGYILNFTCEYGLKFFQKNITFGHKWPLQIFLGTLKHELLNLKRDSLAGRQPQNFMEALDTLLHETDKHVAQTSRPPNFWRNSQPVWREPGNSAIGPYTPWRDRRNSGNQTNSLADSDANWRA